MTGRTQEEDAKLTGAAVTGQLAELRNDPGPMLTGHISPTSTPATITATRFPHGP